MTRRKKRIQPSPGEWWARDLDPHKVVGVSQGFVSLLRVDGHSLQEPLGTFQKAWTRVKPPPPVEVVLPTPTDAKTLEEGRFAPPTGDREFLEPQKSAQETPEVVQTLGHPAVGFEELLTPIDIGNAVADALRGAK